MRLLLDTHVFLWCVNDEKSLSREARSLITNAEEVYVSSVSIWEIAIKVKLNKLEADIHKITDAIVKSGYKELPFSVRHAVAVKNLDNIQRDPFDRMLIAQAINEPLILLTADATIEKYSDLVHLI